MTLIWTPVTDRVFVTTLEPHRVNVGLVVGDHSAMLIDSGNTPQQGADLLASAAALTGKPITHVALTHDHHDHTGGLAAMSGIESIAHENLTGAAVSRTRSRWPWPSTSATSASN